MYELTYECETFSAGMSATDTIVEALEIMVKRIKNNSVGGVIKNLRIKQVDKPIPCLDGWGRTIKEPANA